MFMIRDGLRSLEPQSEPNQDLGDQTSCHLRTSMKSMPTRELRDTADWHRSSNRTVIISIVDEIPKGYQLAINFYRGSILKMNITNFFFVGTTKTICSKIALHCNAPCYSATALLGEDVSRSCSMRIRLELMLQLLVLKVTVLHVDTDVYFFKNPLPNLNHTTYDLETPPTGLNNSFLFDFFLIRPTSCSIKAIYTLIRKKAFPCVQHDKQTLTRKLDGCFEVPPNTPLKIFTLNHRHFPDSYHYFDKYERHFAGASLPCQECVIVHNNMSTTKQIIYRFMEAHMWHFDATGYYSNPGAKYLIFENPLETETEEVTLQKEQSALVSALAIGRVLGRIVLLPKLHHWGIWCPFSSHYDIDVFDRHFAGQYRENTFLKNPLVPTGISTASSTPILIDSSSDCFMYYTLDELNTTHIYTPRDRTHGANSQEIEDWFLGLTNIPILNFRCLYNAFSNFTDETEEKYFKQTIRKALLPNVVN